MVRFGYFVIVLCLFIITIFNVNAQKVGIGTNTPAGEFHVTLPYSYSGITFTGGGVNDILVNYAAFNGLGIQSYIVEITNSGPNPNILKWSNNGGTTWNENVSASTTPISMGNGVYFSFSNTFGHLYGDKWTWQLVQSYPDGLVVKLGNTALGHTNPTQRLDVAGGIKTDSISINQNAGMNRVLKSDAIGKASWKTNDQMMDTDGDTKIELEKTPDEDTIRFTIAGSENWIMSDHRMEPRQSGHSIFIGEKAGMNDDFTLNENIGIGFNALKETYTGYRNTAIGSFSLLKNTSGYQNMAIGDSSLYANTYGHDNLAIGASSLRNNIGGCCNYSVGYKNLYNNTDGYGNISIGYLSNFSNTSGSNNICIGNFAMVKATTIHESIAIGQQALENNIGGGCVGIGSSVLKNNSGYGCTSMGYNACVENTTGWYTTGFGFNALYSNTTGNNNTAMGVSTLFSNTQGSNNCAFGAFALKHGNANNNNTAIGTNSLFNNNTGDNDTSLGFESSYANTTGHDNCSIGYQAGRDCNIGNYNTCVGASALNKNISGYSNVAVGMQALYTSTSTDGNVGIGLQSLFATTGGFNTGLGYYSGGTGSYTHAVSLGASTQNTASYQVRVGNASITSIGGYTGWSNLSDARFKSNIKHDVPGLAFINQLEPITYTLKIDALNDFLHIPDSIQRIPSFKEGYARKSEEIQSGFIAQDVERIAIELGYSFSGIDKPKNANDLYSLRYAEFTVPLVKAVQELSNENVALKKKIETLESKITQIISSIEAQNKNNNHD